MVWPGVFIHPIHKGLVSAGAGCVVENAHRPSCGAMPLCHASQVCPLDRLRGTPHATDYCVKERSRGRVVCGEGGAAEWKFPCSCCALPSGDEGGEIEKIKGTGVMLSLEGKWDHLIWAT